MMAEVVGLVASIATLIEAAGKTGRTISRIRRLQASPPRYILAAQDEIERFTAALDLIQDVLNNGLTAPSDKAKAEVAKLHDQAILALDEFDDFLKEKVVRDQPAGNSALKLRRRAWVKEVLGEAQSEFIDFQQRLMSIKQNLQLVLLALQFQDPSKASLHLQRVSVVQAGVTTGMVAGDRDLTAAYLEQVVVTSTTTMATSGRDNVSSIAARNVAERDNYVVFEMQQAPRGCRQHCPCQCHLSLRGTTPRWLQGLMGTVFLSLSGVPLVNRRACDVKGCDGKSSANGTAHLQYVMPSWALPYAVEATATWCTLGGLGGTWSLRIPRFMNNDDLFRKFLWLTDHGTVEDFQALMATSGMRAFDIFDGSTNINATLFLLAINTVRSDICRMLVENGADVSYHDVCGVSTASFFWSKHFASNAFEELKDHAVLAQAYESLNLPPGHKLVVINAHEELAVHLKNFPAAVTTRDDDGFTLLHWAAACGALEALELLIEAGADVNAVCKRGRTPLMRASEAACPSQMCDMLIRGGANVNKTDLSGNNALIWIVSTEPVDRNAIALLLDAGTDIHHVTKMDMTALTRAARGGYAGCYETCSLLLERGALLDQTDHFGWTPSVYAIDNNAHDVLDLFIKKGAALNNIAKAVDATNITIAAMKADTRTMRQLSDARIQGLPMDEENINEYWRLFDNRDESFFGVREPIEVERDAFQNLLDSIIPLDPSLALSRPEPLRLMPGTFPSEESPEKACIILRTEQSNVVSEKDDTDACLS